MLGAIIGDIAGSRFEFDNIKSKEFTLLDASCEFTDDTVMSIAVAKALVECDDVALFGAKVEAYMHDFGNRYPNRGYGGRFAVWLMDDNPKPYGSFGNGSAMRISSVGFLAQTEIEVKAYSQAASAPTHTHKEGIKGAEAIAMAIFWARKGLDKKEIIKRFAKDYYPEIESETCSYDYLVKHYSWDYGMGSVTCQSSVPQAIACFNEAKDFEDVIRTSVSIGGDSDTIAAMAGGIAEAYYGIPSEIEKRARTFLPKEFIDIVDAVRAKVKNIRT
ncbi:MAG: ADP-ribosylglycohydrolase family protein [Clostridiales bacterium]|nr:ADP-ribosylglycohydrolase family protein [Clostridiales bacterium]